MGLTEIDRHYKNEEKLNAYSHGLGVFLAIIGSYFLIEKVNANDKYGLFGVIIYCFTLILLFSSSTLYHLAHRRPIKDKLRILDHISIYFLIAGTYTPVALITLIDGNGWTIFYVVWGIAVIGTILKLFFTGKFEALSLLLYVFMGWLIVFDFQNLLKHTTTEGLILLALGGAFYTLGIIFYAIRKIPYNHVIWHFFVLGGAISHWLFVYLEVL